MENGALGPYSQTWNLSGPREERIEAIYAVPLLNDRVKLGGFGLVEVNAPQTSGRAATGLTGGAQIDIGL